MIFKIALSVLLIPATLLAQPVKNGLEEVTYKLVGKKLHQPDGSFTILDPFIELSGNYSKPSYFYLTDQNNSGDRVCKISGGSKMISSTTDDVAGEVSTFDAKGNLSFKEPNFGSIIFRTISCK